MAYRDSPAAPRIATLEALIAEEPAVQVELRALRIRHGDLVEEADRLGLAAEQAREAVEYPGVLTRLFGGKARRQAELARLDGEVAAANAAVAASVEAERAASARLGAIEAARAELADVAVRQQDRLKDEAGPDGDAYRALDQEIAEIDALIARIRSGLTPAERADEAARSVRDAHDALLAVRNRRQPGGLVGVAIRAAEGDVEEGAVERLRGCLFDLATAMEHLARALDALEDLVPDAPTPRLREAQRAPIAEPPESSPLLAATPAVTSLVDTALSVLQGALTVRTTRRTAIQAQQAAVAEQAMRRRG